MSNSSDRAFDAQVENLVCLLSTDTSIEWKRAVNGYDVLETMYIAAKDDSAITIRKMRHAVFGNWLSCYTLLMNGNIISRDKSLLKPLFESIDRRRVKKHQDKVQNELDAAIKAFAHT
jgi:hypothetical protein